MRADDFSPPLRTRLLVLQPTPFCNLDCDYCYLPDRGNRARMSLSTLRAAGRTLRDDGLLADEITIVWHAGEPLVLPPTYYEEAFAELAQALGPGVQVTHAMQTNATLIEDVWCRFFARHRVAVGVSVDGPVALHDRHRRTRSGRGTHAAVLRGLQALRAHGLPFHAIAVVTADTLAHADAFYDWFEAQGITELGCNFDEAEGVHAGSSLQGHEAAHQRFMERVLQRSLQGRVVVRELATARRSLREPLPAWHWRDEVLLENSQVMPLALITVAHNGDFGTFSPELPGQHWPAWGNFVLGNVHRNTYLQALRTPAFSRLWQAVLQGVLACRRQCAYFEVCGGGAPANKLYETGSLASTETLHCRSMIQRPFDAVLRQAELEAGLAA